MNPTDTELVKSARCGDIESFRVLFERYWKMAVSLANSHVFDRHLAEDVAQEAFVVAFNQLNNLNDGRAFVGWLSMIVRRTSYRKSASASCDSLSRHEPVAPGEDGGEEKEVLHVAIAQLPESQREVVYLRYFGELSYEEIAQATDSTTASVHGLLQRARNSLSKKIGKLSNR